MKIKSQEKPIYVTRPFMPPLEEFQVYLKEIWESKWLSNQGKFHKELELKLCEYLGVKHVSLFDNGTLALIVALKVLRITGEVITTPYSFVATTHSLAWNDITPVFVDIEPEYCNMDAEKIEAAISSKTTAILPVNAYGNPCMVDKIKQIANTYGMKVIYDAAPSFGVKHDGKSVTNFGDLAVLSFHATKVFTTFEGGAIICHDDEMKKRIDFLKNFGFADEVTVVGQGINGKMNELQAAMGLLQLNYIDSAIEKRKNIACIYRDKLDSIKGIRYMDDMVGVDHNYSYFPIFIKESEYGESRGEVYDKLRTNNIFARRYYYPLISQFPAYRGFPSASAENLPMAEQISKEVICLPIYPDLDTSDIERVIDLLKGGK